VTTALEGSVAIARDLASALHLVRHARTAPAAVILDFELGPGVDGAMVLAALRQAGCLAPVAFHTGAPVRAAAVLASRGRGETPPVFSKDLGGGLVTAWLATAVGAADGAHSSGVRPKAR
jgi:CheY-like chemotaxis protein